MTSSVDELGTDGSTTRAPRTSTRRPHTATPGDRDRSLALRLPARPAQNSMSNNTHDDYALAVAELVAACALRTGRNPKKISLSDFRTYGEEMWGVQCYRSVAHVLPSVGGFEGIRDAYFSKPMCSRRGGKKPLWAQKDILVRTVASLGAFLDEEDRDKAELLALARVGASRPGT